MMTKGYLLRRQAKDQEFMEEIRTLRYQNDVLKAQVRQYRTKARKIKRIAFAAIDRDDNLHETANMNIERGRLPNSSTKSDEEDDDNHQQLVND